MTAEEVIAGAEEITVSDASQLMGLHPNSVRNQLRSGHLEGRRVGREWVVYVLYDKDGQPLFLARYPKKDQ